MSSLPDNEWFSYTPDKGIKIFFIILYLRFNLRSSAVASSYEHLSMGMVLRIPSLFYFTIMVSPFMSKCTLPVFALIPKLRQFSHTSGYWGWMESACFGCWYRILQMNTSVSSRVIFLPKGSCHITFYRFSNLYIIPYLPVWWRCLLNFYHKQPGGMESDGLYHAYLALLRYRIPALWKWKSLLVWPNPERCS